MNPPRRVPPLPNRRSDFVYSPPGKCFPACIVMCCRYWIHYEPNLSVPLTLEEMEIELGDSYYSKTGLWVERLRQYLNKDEIQELDGERFDAGLTVEIHFPKDIEDLYPFFLHDPPVPIILVYNKSFTERNIIGDSHAVIAQSLDYEKEKISVIDPAKGDLKDPYPYDFNRFRLGWKNTENLTLVVAPIDRLRIISGQKVEILKQTTLLGGNP